ncbi:hypothetical protein OYC64_017028 [Pagothenia borchgrevinki]|uniref:Immunoglobulin domain-containing protein n=1 Tax=Pagothenia borchgrevinki TaxID=8213 RepID=A0ABD2HM23_PAGBO
MNTFYALFFLLHASGIEGAAEINVEGFVGGDVSFQCSHKFASKTTKYLCKNACKGIEDRLVTVQSGAAAESGRITLVDSGAGAFSVTFRQLQLSDMGTYWCAVERFGFDTYTSVQLTVNEGVTNETRTVKPELSRTWTYENMSNSTQLTSAMDTSNSAILSAATNNSNGGEQNVSTGTVLFATVGTLGMLTILMLALIIRKCRESLKPQPRVGFNCGDLFGADKRKQANCENNEIVEQEKSLKNTSQRLSCTQHPKMDPPTSASTAPDFHTYENICCSKGTAHSRFSPANNGDEQYANTVIYIKPLPPLSGRTVKGCLRKPTNEPTETTNAKDQPTESCTSNAPTCQSRAVTEVRPGSLWFGLNLSKTE